MIPIYNAIDQKTAVIVSDFPDEGERFESRYWVESSFEGDRFCKQKKKTNGSWSRIVKSPYAKLAGGIVIEPDNHAVIWLPIDTIKDSNKILRFLNIFQKFNPCSMFRDAMAQQKRRVEREMNGEAIFAIGGIPQYPSTMRRLKAQTELSEWDHIFRILIKRAEATT